MAGELALPVLPFEAATRKLIAPMSGLAFTPGSAASGKSQDNIPPSGLLARIHLSITAVATVTLNAGTAALDWSGPWSSLSKIRVTTPGGLDQFALSGFATYLQNIIERYQREFESAQVATAPSNFAARVYVAPTAAGANTWEFGLTIPVALNEREALGLLMMQNSASAFQLQCEFNTTGYSTTAGQAPVLVTGAAVVAYTGTITPVIESFAVPEDRDIPLPPADFAHTYKEFTRSISGVGEMEVPITDRYRFLSILHHVVMNNTPNSADVDSIALSFSSTFKPTVEPNRMKLRRQHEMYGRALPNGVFVHDFLNQGIPNFGTFRDTVQGEKVSDLKSLITVGSGATLGTNASRVLTVTRQLQYLSK